MVAAHEVAARPAEHREAEGTAPPQNIETKTARVGERGAFVVDAAVDAATEMLDELAEDARVHRADAPPEVDADALVMAPESRSGLGACQFDSVARGAVQSRPEDTPMSGHDNGVSGVNGEHRGAPRAAPRDARA